MEKILGIWIVISLVAWLIIRFGGLLRGEPRLFITCIAGLCGLAMLLFGFFLYVIAS